jgi:hypothetical protein
MGEKISRKKRFLAKHPYCCFCGGTVTATTEDHFPPRSVFIGRLWPEGHVFPACFRCNNTTRNDEQLMALICRVKIEDDGAGSSEWEKILDGIKWVMPDVHASLRMSIAEKRASLRKLGAKKAAGTTYADVPLISIAHPRFQESAKRFATKLFCSLYYKHTGKILKSTGRIFFDWRTNTQSFADFFRDAGAKRLLVHFPDLRSQGNNVNDQFRYAFSIADVDPPAAVFGVEFNQAVAMIGIVMGDTSHFNLPMPDEVLLRPLPPE